MPNEKEIAKLVISLEAQLKDFKGKLTDAKKVINDFAGTAEDSFKKSDKSANTFMSTLKGFISAQAILGAVRKGFNELKQLVVESTAAYRNQQNALSSLRAALGYVPPELVKQATALQNLTGIADDQINLAQAAVGAWIKETDAIKKVTEAAIDFGKAKRIDVVSAAELLTKSIVSETNALGRYGIKIDAAVGTSERLGQVINGVNSAYKGWAEELGRTDVGRIDIIKAKMDDVKETIGKGLLPAQEMWNGLLLKALELISKINIGFKIREDESKKANLSIKEGLETEAKQIESQLELAKKTNQEMVTWFTAEGQRVEKLKVAEVELQIIKDQIGGINKSLDETSKKQLLKPSKPKDIESSIKIIETSLTVFQAQLKQTLQEIDIAYKEGRISIDEYYGSLRDQAQIATAKEISALEDLLPQLQNKNDIDETNNKIKAKQIELETTLAGYRAAENVDVEKQNEEKKKQIDLIKNLQQVIDVRSAGTITGTDKIKADVDAESKEEQNNILNNVKDRVEQQKLLEASRISWEKEQARRLTEYEQAQRITNLEILSESFGRVTDVFEKFYDQRLQIVNNLEQSIQNAEQAGDTAKAERLKKQLEASKAAARRQFYISKSLALAEAVINAALSITKVYSQTGIYGTLALLGVSATNAMAIGEIMGQMIAGPGFEKGGSVQGQSGRDAIRAHLTNGEFVEPVDTVQHYGTGVMEALRQMSIPRSLLEPFSRSSPRRSSFAFAEGGLATSGGQEMSLQINNIVSPALMGDYLSSRAGQSLILNVISQNSYEVRRRISV